MSKPFNRFYYEAATAPNIYTIFVIKIKAWSHLLSVKLEDEQLQQFWESDVRESLKSRIYQVGSLLRGFPG